MLVANGGRVMRHDERREEMGDICKDCEGKGVVVKDGLTWTCQVCYGLGRILRDEAVQKEET